MSGDMLVLTVRQVLGLFFRRMVLPYASLFILELGGTSSQIGIVNSLLPLAGLLMFPVSGYLTDRTSRVKLIALTGYLSATSMPLIVFAEGFYQVLLIRLAVAVAGALFTPASTALMADYVPGEMRGRVMAALGRGSMMVGAAGGGTGGPGMGYLFTVPVMAASIIGGLLYAVNPAYTWYCILATTVV